MTDIIFTNAQIIREGEVIRGTVTVTAWLIDAIDQGATTVPGANDLGSDMLIPGLIKLHTDNLERRVQSHPKVDWAHAAATLAHDGELASTGITTVFDSLRVGSIRAGKRNVRKYARQVASGIWDLRRAGALRINHYLHLRAEICSETLVEEMAEFGPEDRVGIVNLMDNTPGQRQFRDIAKLKQYVAKKADMTDAEFEDHVAHLKVLQASHGERHEVEAVAAARRYGAVLVSHDDTTAAHVATSAGHGIGLAEFPTTVEAARARHAHGSRVMVGAPNLMRGGSHSGNVSAHELAEVERGSSDRLDRRGYTVGLHSRRDPVFMRMRGLSTGWSTFVVVLEGEERLENKVLGGVPSRAKGRWGSGLC